MANSIDIFMGNHIRDVRIRMGVSLKDLAENLSISPRQLELYEEGVESFKASILYGIADYLGLSMVNLLPQEDDVSPYGFLH